MKLRVVIILIFSLLLLSIEGVNSQTSRDSSINSIRSTGGEKKGFYIGGTTALLGGTAIGFISNGFSDNPRSGLPFISGTMGIAPTSLLGLGLGSLFAKKQSAFDGPFQIGMGVSYSSPIFSKFLPDNSHLAGVNIRLLSKEFGRWRYNLGFSQYFSKDYIFNDIQSYFGRNKLSWWELDLNLHYLIYNESGFTIYPFIGTQFNSVNAQGDNVKTEILANYGAGINISISDRFALYSEIEYTLDPDDNPGNFILAFGVLYSL